MDRNESEASAFEREAREARERGNERRAADMQHHADYLRDEVKRGTPVYRPLTGR